MTLLVKDGLDLLYFVFLPPFSSHETAKASAIDFKALDHQPETRPLMPHSIVLQSTGW